MRTADGLRNLFSGVWSFFMHRRAEHDRQYLEVLSDPSGRQDVHDAKLAHEVGTGRQAQEAARGFTLSGG
jgi:hypothetical protein